MIDKGRCDNRFIWNPGTCECKRDKLSVVGKYLDFANCKRRKILIDKLVKECSEDINGNDMIYNVTLNDHEKVCNFCTIYIVLLIIVSITLMGIGSAYIHFYLYTIKNCFNKLLYECISESYKRN